jgi:hypothetical protein
MWTKPTTRNATRWFVCLGLTCLAVAAFSAVPAAGQRERAGAGAQPLASEVKALQERAALAERQVAIKQAAVRIAEARKGVAEANVKIAKASIQAADASVSRWKAEAKRIARLASATIVDRQVVDEAEAKLAFAKASLAEAEGRRLLAEREVAVEEARRQLAQAELAEAELRRDQPRAKLPQAPKKVDAPPTLLKARLDAAQKAQAAAMEALQQTKRTGDLVLPVGKPEEVYTWSVRWLNAQRDMSDKKDNHIAALEGHFKRMKELQQRVTKLREGGLVSSVEPAAAAWYLAEAELWLAKEKAK